jgi:hypothetical protein
MEIKRFEILPDGRIVVSLTEELIAKSDADDAFGTWKARRESNA